VNSVTHTAPAEDRPSAGATVFRGSAWQTLGRLLPQAYTIVTSIVAARILGASGLGRLTFIVFVQVTLVTALTANLPNATSRFVAEAVGAGEAGGVHALRRLALRAEAAAALVGAATLLTIAALGAQPRWAWGFAAIACASSVLQTVPSSLLIGLQRWREASIIGLTTGACAVVAKITVLEAGLGIAGMLGVDSVTMTVNFLAAGILARRATAAIAAPSTVGARGRAQRAWRYALLGSPTVFLTYVVWGRSEVFFLDRFSSDAQIAIYSLAFSAVYMLTFAPMAVGAAAG